jgi:hypothetical protein
VCQNLFNLPPMGRYLDCDGAWNILPQNMVPLNLESHKSREISLPFCPSVLWQAINPRKNFLIFSWSSLWHPNVRDACAIHRGNKCPCLCPKLKLQYCQKRKKERSFSLLPLDHILSVQSHFLHSNLLLHQTWYENAQFSFILHF